jgi:hypothetical protein
VKRRLFNVLAGVSLVLCVAVAVLWVLNIAFREEITYGQPFNATDRRWIVTVMIDSDGVSVWCAHDHRVDTRMKPIIGWRFEAGRYPTGVGGALSYFRPYHRLLGFACSRTLNINGYQGILVVNIDRYTFTAPYWLFVLVCVAGVMWTYRKRQLPIGNFCSKCGYDLRATPDRCPECGSVSEKVNG